MMLNRFKQCIGAIAGLTLLLAGGSLARADAYTYDVLGRLTSVSTKNATVNYTYDAAGNRSSRVTTRQAFRFFVVPLAGGKLIYPR